MKILRRKHTMLKYTLTLTRSLMFQQNSLMFRQNFIHCMKEREESHKYLRDNIFNYCVTIDNLPVILHAANAI